MDDPVAQRDATSCFALAVATAWRQFVKSRPIVTPVSRPKVTPLDDVVQSAEGPAHVA